MPKLRLNKDQDSGNVGGDQNNEIVDVPPSRKTKAGALPSNDEVVEAKSGDARKPHLTRINNSPLKKVLERASQLVATGMALPQPEHMALQVLQELGIEVSENIRQELLNLGLAAATKKSVDRSQDLLVAVSEAAGQGTPELKHLKEVLATSNERFGTLFQQGLADHEMAMLAAPPEYTPMTRAELEQSASRLSTIMSLNPTDMVLAALGKEDGSGGYDPVIGRE